MIRILIVDDDYISRLQAKALLGAYGDCDGVPNGKIALDMYECALAEKMPYHLVTMDILMPGMSGQDVVAGIRRIEEQRKLPSERECKILMLTSQKTMRDVSSSYYEGCSQYVNKPLRQEDLAKAMTEMGLA